MAAAAAADLSMAMMIIECFCCCVLKGRGHEVAWKKAKGVLCFSAKSYVTGRRKGERGVSCFHPREGREGSLSLLHLQATFDHLSIVTSFVSFHDSRTEDIGGSMNKGGIENYIIETMPRSLIFRSRTSS